MTTIYHLAVGREWEEAVAGGEYRRSTLGRSLDEEGFIHCSFATQVDLVANLFYGGRDDVVLLSIEPERLVDPVRVEAVDGGDQLFPHLYGPLPVDAVISVRPVRVGPEGRLIVRELLASSPTGQITVAGPWCDTN